MARLRSQGGYVGYVSLIAALVIVAVLATSSLKQFGGAGSTGKAGAANDGAAQAEVQHAFAALQACARKQAGNFSGCDVDQVIENEPTLAPARNRIVVAGAGTAVLVTVASSSKNEFSIGLSRGSLIRTCRTAGVGSCPATGRW